MCYELHGFCENCRVTYEGQFSECECMLLASTKCDGPSQDLSLEGIWCPRCKVFGRMYSVMKSLQHVWKRMRAECTLLPESVAMLDDEIQRLEHLDGPRMEMKTTEEDFAHILKSYYNCSKSLAKMLAEQALIESLEGPAPFSSVLGFRNEAANKDESQPPPEENKRGSSSGSKIIQPTSHLRKVAEKHLKQENKQRAQTEKDLAKLAMEIRECRKRAEGDYDAKQKKAAKSNPST